LVDDEDSSDNQTAFEFQTNHGEHLLTNAVVAFKEISTNYTCIVKNNGTKVTLRKIWI
jgi:hypothetical protein